MIFVFSQSHYTFLAEMELLELQDVRCSLEMFWRNQLVKCSRITIFHFMLLFIRTGYNFVTLLRLLKPWEKKWKEQDTVSSWKPVCFCVTVFPSHWPTLALLSVRLGNGLCTAGVVYKPPYCHGTLLAQAKLIFPMLTHQWYLVP